MFNFNGKTVADKFVLVACEFATPPATKRNRKAEEAIIQDMIQQGITEDVARATARSYTELYPDKALKAIRSPFYSFNTWLDRMTLRWIGGKGAGKLLSVHNIDAAERRKAEADLIMLPLWHKFVSEYPARLERTKQQLGAYFDPADYLTPEQLPSRFRFELSFTAIGDPASYDLGVVSESAKQQMIDAMKTSAEQVTREYARSLKEALMHLNQKLIGGQQDGQHQRFHASNVSNLLDLIQADLNASGNHELAVAMVDVTHAARLAENAAVLKDDKNSRINAANAAASAASKLAGLC